VIADQPARDQARKNLRANLVVEAGAGTGKTTLLTDRLLFLVLAGGPEGEGLALSRVAALTFTEKAAGEIKLRLAERLHDIVDALADRPGPPALRERTQFWLHEARADFHRKDEDIRRRAEAALAELDRAAIDTFHTFASSLLRLFPLEAEAPPEFRVDPGPRFDELFRREWDRWLEEELGAGAPRAPAWRECLARVGVADFETLARALAGAPEGTPEPAAFRERLSHLAADVDGVAAGKPPPGGSSRIRESLQRIAGRLRALLAAAARSRPSLSDGTAAENPEAPLPPPEDWKAESPKAWPKPWTGLPGEDIYRQAAAIANAAGPEGVALIPRVQGLLAPFLDRFRLAFETEGLLTFDDLLRRCRDLLTNHPEVRRRLKAAHDALLVDEFQDTDPLQGEILFFLSEDLHSEAGRWQDVSLAAGKLFIVGDPKQSIYRFRGADIRAYQSFVDAVLAQGGVKCDLQTNFRSHEKLVGPVNTLFADLMEASPGLQPAYVPLNPRPESGLAERGVELVLYPGAAKAASAPEVQRAEARWIARWIVDHCGAGGPFRAGDVALLFRSTFALGIYLDALKSAAIPYVVESDRAFYSTPEVTDVLNLLRVLDAPEDRAALAGLLRSPLVLLEDRHLATLAEAGGLNLGSPEAGSLPAGAAARVDEFFGVIRDLRPRAAALGLGEFVHEAFLKTGMIALASAAYHGEQTASNLLKIARLAEEAGGERGMSLTGFIREVRRRVEESVQEGESPLVEERLNAVRLLTIHKAKGLEFPVVFLPNLSAHVGGGGGEKPVLRRDWRENWMGHRLREKGAADLPMAFLEWDEKQREEREAVRLLYVACTRARERLFLLGRAEGETGFLSLIRGAARSTEGDAWELPDGLRLPVSWIDSTDSRVPTWTGKAEEKSRIDLAPLAVLWEKRRREKVETEARPLVLAPSGLEGAAVAGRRNGAGKNAASVGQICHGVLEKWDYRNPALLPELTKWAARELAEEGPVDGDDARRSLAVLATPGAAEPLMRESLEILQGFASTEAAKVLAGSEILGRELPFLFAREGAVVRGRMDLLCRRRGRLVVVDFKTDRLGPGEAASRSESYREQGNAYAEAVSRALKEPCDFEVVFLRTGERVELIKSMSKGKILCFAAWFFLGALIVFLGGGRAVQSESLKNDKTETATFAGGCFWCMEPPFEKLEGVSDVVSGYMGGAKPNPTYEDVCAGNTGHAEVVQVTFNPLKISYQKLLDTFWFNIDPTDFDGQFADKGSQYRTAIFFHSTEQKKAAEASRLKIVNSGKFKEPIATRIDPATAFHPAENYHQDYYKKNPFRYKSYHVGSGRDGYLKKTWGEGKKD